MDGDGEGERHRGPVSAVNRAFSLAGWTTCSLFKEAGGTWRAAALPQSTEMLLITHYY